MTSEPRPAVECFCHKIDTTYGVCQVCNRKPPFDREAVRAEQARAVEVELAMCAIANSEASSEWIDGFEFAWKRVKAVLEKQDARG